MSKLSEAWFDRLMAESLPEEEAEALARQLQADGFEQTSAKYRHVARLPPGETGLEALTRVAPREAERIRQQIEFCAADTYRRIYAERDGHQRELDLRTFKKFKELTRGR